MKVLYVLKRYPQVSQTFVVRELLGLESHGVDVGVDALGPSSTGLRHAETDSVKARVRHLPKAVTWRDVWPTHLRVAARKPVTYTRCALRARQNDWRRFVQAGIVADRVHRERYDHLHAHFASSACEVARDAAALAGVTFSVTAHAKDIYQDGHAAQLERRTKGASSVVSVSAHNAAYLREKLPTASVAHVANGVGIERPAEPNTFGPILCVARLVEKKGIDTLIDAFAIARRTHPQLELEIVGDGELRDVLREQVSQLLLHESVHFLGALASDEVDSAYRRASMVVLPCRVSPDGDRDGLPTVLVEALARAVPVISTDIVGIPELVQHEVTGLLVSPDEPRELAAAIVRLLDDPELARRLAEDGRERVATEYNPDRSARMLKDVFTRARGYR